LTAGGTESPDYLDHHPVAAPPWRAAVVGRLRYCVLYWRCGGR
jgi:hypothetical protein